MGSKIAEATGLGLGLLTLLCVFVVAGRLVVRGLWMLVRLVGLE